MKMVYFKCPTCGATIKAIVPLHVETKAYCINPDCGEPLMQCVNQREKDILDNCDNYCRDNYEDY